jgi:hypothetical protein
VVCKPMQGTKLSLPEDQKMVAAALVSCIDPDLLENLVCLEEIEGRTDADEVVDTDLDAWMKKPLLEVAKLSTNCWHKLA